MSSLLQVLEVCLRGLIMSPELECWTVHIDIVRMLFDNEEWSDEALERLSKATLLWKTKMVGLYGRVRTKETTKGKRATQENEPTETTLSFSFPNFETCEHWADAIKFIGPPMFQDTTLWEQRHLAAKRLCRRTNQRNVTRDVLVKVRGSFIFLACSLLNLCAWCTCFTDARKGRRHAQAGGDTAKDAAEEEAALQPHAPCRARWCVPRVTAVTAQARRHSPAGKHGVAGHRLEQRALAWGAPFLQPHPSPV